jgi:6-phosphogluconolactonase (cycloisomerase 2 family)
MTRPLPGTNGHAELRDLVIGGYTAETGGSGPGLTRVRVDAAGWMEVAGRTAVPGPSFVTAHPRLPLLYAVLERETGGVAVLADDPAAPRLLAEHPSGGSFPCHVAADPAGAWLAVANYGDGTVAVFRLAADGMPEPEPLLFPSEGHGPDPERQEGPHAHQAVFGPDGGLHVTDLGTDEVRRFLPDMTPHPAGPVRLAPGTGPRHFVHHEGHWYVAGELDGMVGVYDGDWREIARVPASESGTRNHPSHIAVSEDGGHLYVANRGPDTVTTFEFDGARPVPVRVAEVTGGGVWPRHFALDGDRLYVANQRSDEIAVLTLKDGIPTPTGTTLEAASPSCVLTRKAASARLTG